MIGETARQSHEGIPEDGDSLYNEAGLLPLNRNPESENETIRTFSTAKLVCPPTCEDNTCPGERGDGAQGQGSAEAPRQRGGARLRGTLMVTDELGQVGRWGGDEGVHQVRRQDERLAAGGRRRATCKEPATQEQRNRLRHELALETSRTLTPL